MKLKIDLGHLENDEEITLVISKGRKLAQSNTTTINKKLNKIMATLSQFQSYFDRINTAIDDVKADIQVIKDGVVPAPGLSEEEEAQVLATLEGVTAKLEALALENPTAEPVPGEDEIPPVTPVDGGEFGQEEE